jgi:hypothetical protein
MKKLLLLLFVPLFSFGQIFVKQEVLEQGPFAVGDIFTVRYSIIDTGTMDLNTVMFDVNYNNKKVLISGDPIWTGNLDNQSKARNMWNGYLYNIDTNFDPNELDKQYNGGISYTSPSADWGLVRFSAQSSIDIDGFFVEQKFIVQDHQDAYTDYNEAIKLNWSYITERGVNGNVIASGDPRVIDLNASNFVPAGTVTVHLNLPGYTHADDYMINIEPVGWDGTGQYQGVQGKIDASGNFSTTELNQGVEYEIHAFVDSQWDVDAQTGTYPTWLDDVVTVSDVILAFKEAIGTNPDGTGTTFTYSLQSQLANVSRTSPDDPVDFDDSYALLAHLAGILENGANDPNSQDKEFYPITSFNNGAFNWSAFVDKLGVEVNSEEEWLAQRTFTLTDDQPVTFEFGHALMGDVDLSHATPQTVQNQTVGKSTPIMGKSAGGTMRLIETDMDVTSELKNGLVELNIDVNKNDLSGLQLNLSYDKSRLTFKEVVFDTGNTMTNFAKSLDGKIIIGTIDPQAKEVMKSGRPFKVVFEPKQTISNTAGLVSFDVTDAVTKDGTKVKLNIR